MIGGANHFPNVLNYILLYKPIWNTDWSKIETAVFKISGSILLSAFNRMTLRRATFFSISQSSDNNSNAWCTLGNNEYNFVWRARRKWGYWGFFSSISLALVFFWFQWNGLSSLLKVQEIISLQDKLIW